MDLKMAINNLNETDMPQEMINEITATEPIDLKAVYLAGKLQQQTRVCEMNNYTEGEN